MSFAAGPPKNVAQIWLRSSSNPRYTRNRRKIFFSATRCLAGAQKPVWAIVTGLGSLGLRLSFRPRSEVGQRMTSDGYHFLNEGTVEVDVCWSDFP